MPRRASTQSTRVNIGRTDTFTHTGFRVPDPFAARESLGASFVHAVLATCFFRCWHHLLFHGAWATLITILNHQGKNLIIEPILLTVLGTVLGFVISYRTTATFERYNEGRKLWSQIVLSSRTFSRLVWFHVPFPKNCDDSERARILIEKKSVINLIEAFAVAVKHYLRGENGIYYKDLYHLVKFLPAYALPAGLPSQVDLANASHITNSPMQAVEELEPDEENGLSTFGMNASPRSSFNDKRSATGPHIKLPEVFPSTTKPERTGTEARQRTSLNVEKGGRPDPRKQRTVLPEAEEDIVLEEASLPPKFAVSDLFPLSILINFMGRGHTHISGKKAAAIRAKMKLRESSGTHNLPLEISFYLSSYIASLQADGIIDHPTTGELYGSLNALVDSLSGLERILTTPIPWSYSFHLWVVTVIYCLALPFQIWKPLGWITIPADVIACFVFFGFLTAGEEIENPFGYDENDLNLDHFTANIIGPELKAITSAPPPAPRTWAFVRENNQIFSADKTERVTPQEWVDRGSREIRAALRAHHA